MLAPMDLEELERRLVPFVRAKLDDPEASVARVRAMPGHAGFSYGFQVRSRGCEEGLYLRLPPPGVRWKGTADVLRQATALRALDATEVPHCRVRWAGDDLQWFECPYFVVPLLEGGDVLGLGSGGWAADPSESTRWEMARQAMRALAGIHKLDWRAAAPSLGPPIDFDTDVARWDRFAQKAADPERLALAPRVRERLLSRRPAEAPVGIFHGDYQPSNLFFSFGGELLAVLDWELVGVGATLNDVGWMATFHDAPAWAEGGSPASSAMRLLPGAEELGELYAEAWGAPLPELRWFRALAAYKFAVISGLNLSLHRRGKRPDPAWEAVALSIEPLLSRALELLG